jgi:membrane-associated protein
MEFLQKLLDTLLHLSPESINDLAMSLGPWLYAALAGVIFAETGLVATPFLPGDSLLFAVGAVAALPGSPINLGAIAILLIAAAVIGDGVNYFIGALLGPRVFTRESSWLLNKKHLMHAHEFYDRHGAKTIILARFVPIVRTFAPFVAGVGKMSYWKFATYNVIGAIGWVLICLFAGYLFGGYEIVQKRFELVVIAIVLISLLPVGIEFLRARGAAKSPKNLGTDSTIE